MNEKEYKNFINLKEKFKNKINFYNENYPDLKKEIEEIRNTDIKKGFIYNNKLENINLEDNIKYIWITDNPGIKEMEADKYCIGISGVAGKNFMEKEGFVNSFEKEVINLNKSPIHTKITSELSKIKNKDILNETQIFMANLAFELQKNFNCELWIMGTSNLNKIFKVFIERFKENYKNENKLLEKVFLFYHFSQGQFKIRLNKEIKENTNLSMKENLYNIGKENKKIYLG